MLYSSSIPIFKKSDTRYSCCFHHIISVTHTLYTIYCFWCRPWSPGWGQSVSQSVQSYPTVCYPMNHSTPGLPVHHQLPESTQTHVRWVSDAIQPPHPLSSTSPPAVNLSQHQGLFKLALHIRWPKYWSFSFNISPSNENPGLSSFRMDWLDLLAIQGTVKKM